MATVVDTQIWHDLSWTNVSLAVEQIPASYTRTGKRTPNELNSWVLFHCIHGLTNIVNIRREILISSGSDFEDLDTYFSIAQATYCHREAFIILYCLIAGIGNWHFPYVAFRSDTLYLQQKGKVHYGYFVYPWITNDYRVLKIYEIVY